MIVQHKEGVQGMILSCLLDLILNFLKLFLQAFLVGCVDLFYLICLKKAKLKNALAKEPCIGLCLHADDQCLAALALKLNVFLRYHILITI